MDTELAYEFRSKKGDTFNYNPFQERQFLGYLVFAKLSFKTLIKI